MFGFGKKKPKRIQLPDVASEYTYIQTLTCESCKGPTSSQRAGASQDGGRMIDHWVVTCKRCGKSRQLELSVPQMDVSALLNTFGK
jgi:RNase P subunit RPR2